MSAATVKETREERAQRLLNKQMDALRDRVLLIEKTARNHAPHLPNGDAEQYIAYIRQLTLRTTAAFEAGAPVPYFGGVAHWGDDE